MKKMSKKQVYVGIGIAVVLVIAMTLLISSECDQSVTGEVTSEVAGEKLLDFAESQGTEGVELENMEPFGDLFYKATLLIDGQELPVFVTKDGEYMVTELVPLDSNTPNVPDTSEETTTEPTQGTASAEKVTIKAYLPLGYCAEELPALLDGLEKKYKGRVSVEYIDFTTEEGAERTRKDGLSCQGLVINGKQTYTIKDSSGKQRGVTFSHPINEQYTAEDLKTVVKMLLGE